ncbi:hypothetical protein [Microbacterium sp.]|uniref:hypothetical protein n=1 Tax=Microbacterium sp. TaxID=51671 RepID=UPI003A8CB247
MKAVAALSCVIVAARVTLQQGLTAGIVLSVLLLPVWITVLWRQRGGSMILGLGVLALVSGFVLTSFASSDHEVSDSLLQMTTFSLVTLLGGIGVVLWARSILGPAMTALWYGTGLLISVATHGLDPVNIWKFDLSVPVIVITLAIAMLSHRLWIELPLLVLLAIVCALNDSRSAGSMLLVAAVLVTWQSVAGRLSGGSTTVRTLSVFGFVAVIGYFSLQAFILEGWFGTAAATRSEEQIAQSGSLLLGGRPEIGASTELIAANPFGFGAGTLANGTDLLVAKTGMARLNYDPNNGYVQKYMFGEGFEVHSVLGDLWLRFGLFGAAMLIVMLVAVALGTANQVSRRNATGLTIFLTIQIFWDSFFAPLFSTSISTAVLAVALVLAPRASALDRTIESEFVSFGR